MSKKFRLIKRDIGPTEITLSAQYDWTGLHSFTKASGVDNLAFQNTTARAAGNSWWYWQAPKTDNTITFYSYDGTTTGLGTFILGAAVFAPTGVIRLKGYTVATLPAGTQGDTAFVTDALAPAFLTAVVGGGAVVTPVFHDGTNWKAY